MSDLAAPGSYWATFPTRSLFFPAPLYLLRDCSQINWFDGIAVFDNMKKPMESVNASSIIQRACVASARHPAALSLALHKWLFITETNLVQQAATRSVTVPADGRRWKTVGPDRAGRQIAFNAQIRKTCWNKSQPSSRRISSGTARPCHTAAQDKLMRGLSTGASNCIFFYVV